MNYISREAPGLPTHSAPTEEDWVPVTVGGTWYWDGSRWRRTVENPWSVRRRRPGRRESSVTSTTALIVPLAFLAGLAIEILGRALATAIRVVVGVFAVGAVVALAVFLIAALLHA
jgi:hypothetical protein